MYLSKYFQVKVLKYLTSLVFTRAVVAVVRGGTTYHHFLFWRYAYHHFSAIRFQHLNLYTWMNHKVNFTWYMYWEASLKLTRLIFWKYFRMSVQYFSCIWCTFEITPPKFRAQSLTRWLQSLIIKSCLKLPANYEHANIWMWKVASCVTCVV